MMARTRHSMSEGSRITHVLVSERISGTKAEKFLKGATKAYTKNGRKKVVLVDCESAVLDWVRVPLGLLLIRLWLALRRGARFRQTGE